MKRTKSIPWKRTRGPYLDHLVDMKELDGTPETAGKIAVLKAKHSGVACSYCRANPMMDNCARFAVCDGCGRELPECIRGGPECNDCSPPEGDET